MFGAEAVILVAVVALPTRHDFPRPATPACHSLPAEAHALGDVNDCGWGLPVWCWAARV